MLREVARAVLQYTFAALLALLSTQAVVPSARGTAAIEIVCWAEAEQQTPRKTQRISPEVQVRQPAPAYASRTKPEPDAACLFQRPPPSLSLLS